MFEFLCVSNMSSDIALYFDVVQPTHGVWYRVVDVCQFCVESLQLRGASFVFFQALVQSRRLNFDVFQTCRPQWCCILMLFKQCIAFGIASLMIIRSAWRRSV